MNGYSFKNNRMKLWVSSKMVLKFIATSTIFNSSRQNKVKRVCFFCIILFLISGLEFLDNPAECQSVKLLQIKSNF